MELDSFGSELRATRLRIKLTQTALAERLGTTRATINQWEQGRSLPELPKAIELAMKTLVHEFHQKNWQKDHEKRWGELRERIARLSFSVEENQRLLEDALGKENGEPSDSDQSDQLENS